MQSRVRGTLQVPGSCRTSLRQVACDPYCLTQLQVNCTARPSSMGPVLPDWSWLLAAMLLLCMPFAAGALLTTTAGALLTTAAGALLTTAS
jgi:hypothetical protein